MSTHSVRIDLNMGLSCRLITLLVIGVALYYGKKCYFGGCQHSQFDVTMVTADKYFGPNVLKAGDSLPKDSVEIKPFKIAYPEEDLKDLKSRLAGAKYIENNVQDVAFNYGFPSTHLKEVVKYWQTKYDWRREEAKLNAIPQFTTQIEGLNIHFLHIKADPSAKKVIPLLASHGWPGSFLEYVKSIPLLTKPDADGLAYELIVPSIPGYGYSEAPHKKGFNAAATARIFVKLMKRLGHQKFVIHGGDWGNLISKMISVGFPDNVIGTHLLMNMNPSPNSPGRIWRSFMAAFFPSWYFGENSEKEYSKVFPFFEKFSEMMLEMGYMHIQATKPDTVATALRDSPVGLAAYILEKFSTWTNSNYRDLNDGGLTKKFTLDELLTNIMIYWTSGNIASSQRYYKENMAQFMEFDKVIVPGYSGVVDAPYELARAPRKLIECLHENLVHYSELPRGGHFTAFEEPELVSEDIRKFTKTVLKLRAEEAKAGGEGKKVKDEM